MALEDEIYRLNKNVFGKKAKEIRFEKRDIHYLEDDNPSGNKETNDIELEQEYDIDG